MTHLPRLASLIFNQPHYITSSAAEAILSALNGRIGEIDMSRFTGDPVYNDRGRWAGYSITRNGAAIVPIIGELVNRGAYLGASSGLISYEGLREQLRSAAADPRVKALVLDIDSPGGMVSGCYECAAEVREIARSKPVIAVANSLMASAAYAIASGASRIVASPSSQVGSIGVLYIHADRSGEFAKRGINFTIIQGGAHKADGHPFGPLPDDVHANLQALIDHHYTAFVQLVARGRPFLTEQQIRDTEARVYTADEAVAKGLADAVGTFDQAVAFAESGRLPTRQHSHQFRVAAQAPTQKAAANMQTMNGAPAAEPAGGWEGMSLAQLNEAVAHLRATIGVGGEQTAPAPAANDAGASPPTAAPTAEAVETPPAAKGNTDEIVAQARRDEKARIKGILGLDEAKGRTVAALALAVETDIPTASAGAVLAQFPLEGAKNSANDLYGAIAASGGTPRVSHHEPGEAAGNPSSLGTAMDKLIANTASQRRA